MVMQEETSSFAFQVTAYEKKEAMTTTPWTLIITFIMGFVGGIRLMKIDLRTEEKNHNFSYYRDTEPGHLHLVGKPLDPAVRGVARAKPRSLRRRRLTACTRRLRRILMLLL